MKLDWLFPYIACCQFFLVLYFAFKLPGSFTGARRSAQLSRDVVRSLQGNASVMDVSKWAGEDSWIFRNYISDESRLSYWTSSSLLPRALTVDQYAQYIKLVAVLSDALIEANVTFLMTDGTLLGSFTMHDILPWDDEVNFMARLSDRAKVTKLASSVNRNRDIAFQAFAVDELERRPASRFDTASPSRPIKAVGSSNSTVSFYHRLKFFNKPGAEGDTSLQWPYVDVAFYGENDSHVWQEGQPQKRIIVKKVNFYPLHKRPLAGLWLPAPADTRGYLRAVYGRFRCRTSSWSHRLGKRQRERRVRCKKLARYYPVVWREPTEGGTTREILRYRDRVVRIEEVSETFVRGTRPMTL